MRDVLHGLQPTLRKSSLRLTLWGKKSGELPVTRPCKALSYFTSLRRDYLRPEHLKSISWNSTADALTQHRAIIHYTSTEGEGVWGGGWLNILGRTEIHQKSRGAHTLRLNTGPVFLFDRGGDLRPLPHEDTLLSQLQGVVSASPLRDLRVWSHFFCVRND